MPLAPPSLVTATSSTYQASPPTKLSEGRLERTRAVVPRRYRTTATRVTLRVPAASSTRR